MVEAFLHRDASYEGVFFTAVKTTGIFCRPTCSARKPLPSNVEFFATTQGALLAGFRPCLRCRPMEPTGTTPEWLRPLLLKIEEDPARRWKDADLRSLGLQPDRVRRWFQNNHGMTFHAFHRARRLGIALGEIQGGAGIARAAFDHGYDSLSAFNEAFRRMLGAPPRAARESTRLLVTRIPTPLGPMVACATDEALCLLEFDDRRMLETQLKRLRHHFNAHFMPGVNGVLESTAAELERYFAGRLTEFTIPLDARGTPFQEVVWARLRAIPAGQTRSYKGVATEMGRPTAVRAVARSNGDNRIAILIPCHRVVGSDGKLTGYGGGLWRKKRLLEIEGVQR